jgi:thimet oligopeptidase
MYHAEALPNKSLDSIWKDTEAAYGCFPAFPADVLYRPELGWTHLADYGPRYIAYQNSLAVSKEFKTVWDSASGPLDKDVTRRYRETILERGSSVDASEIIQEFLGRPHTTAGYLKWLNAE